MLRDRDRRRRLERHPEGERHAVGNAAQYPAGVVGLGDYAPVLRAESVVVLAAFELCGAKPSAEFDPFDRGNAEYCGGDPVFHSSEHRIAQSGRKPVHDTLHDAAHRVSRCFSRGNNFVHLSFVVRNAADLSCARPHTYPFGPEQLDADRAGNAQRRRQPS